MLASAVGLYALYLANKQQPEAAEGLDGEPARPQETAEYQFDQPPQPWFKGNGFLWENKGVGVALPREDNPLFVRGMEQQADGLADPAAWNTEEYRASATDPLSIPEPLEQLTADWWLERVIGPQSMRQYKHPADKQPLPVYRHDPFFPPYGNPGLFGPLHEPKRMDVGGNLYNTTGTTYKNSAPQTPIFPTPIFGLLADRVQGVPAYSP